MPGDITGFVSDVGLKPLAGRALRLFLKLDKPSTLGPNLLLRDRYEAVITDATGAFVFSNVVGSDEMLPPSTYTLVAKWDGYLEQDVITGLRVPASGGEISDLISAAGAASPGTVMYGFGPPPDDLTNVLYIDISGSDPVLYAPSDGGI